MEADLILQYRTQTDEIQSHPLTETILELASTKAKPLTHHTQKLSPGNHT